MRTTMDDRPDLTTEAAAGRAGVHPETVRRWARDSRVRAFKDHAGHWMFYSADIDALIIHVVDDELAS